MDIKMYTLHHVVKVDSPERVVSLRGRLKVDGLRKEGSVEVWKFGNLEGGKKAEGNLEEGRKEGTNERTYERMNERSWGRREEGGQEH
jgi:hypothetical protein